VGGKERDCRNSYMLTKSRRCRKKEGKEHHRLASDKKQRTFARLEGWGQGEVEGQRWKIFRERADISNHAEGREENYYALQKGGD